MRTLYFCPVISFYLSYVFSFFIILFCLVPCGRLSWLLVSFWAHVNIVHHIISYHIISLSLAVLRESTAGALLRNTQGRDDHVEDAVRRCHATSADVINVRAPGRKRAVHASHRAAIPQHVQRRRGRRETGDLPQAGRGATPAHSARVGVRRQGCPS